MARNDPPPPDAAKDPAEPEPGVGGLGGPDERGGPEPGGGGLGGPDEGHGPEAGGGGPEASGGGGPRASALPEDPLHRLEERLERASSTAERLIAEVGAAAESRTDRRPPRAGWRAPDDGTGHPHSDSDASGSHQAPDPDQSGPHGPRPPRRPDLDAILGLLESLRELIPPDLEQRLLDALRELLSAVRALIDWYLQRLEGHREDATEVQDIPISWD